MKVVVGKDGKLETVGSADADAKSEAEIRAQIAAQRAELRRIIEGNEQFFDDPMGKPAETKPDETSWKSWLPTKSGVYVACTQGQATGCFADPTAMFPLHYAYFNGRLWSMTTNSATDARESAKKGWYSSWQLYWLRLVEAD